MSTVMPSLKHYIRTYPHSLSPEACQSIITRFEDDCLSQRQITLPGHRSFTEINITPLTHWRDVNDLIIRKVEDYVFLYRQDIGIHTRQWSENYGYEQIRIKRYLPGTDDEFRWHVDVGDYSSARRFLVCFWYLNTVTEGGETTFSSSPDDPPWLISPTEEGKLLIFPPLWMYPHTGTKPLSGIKYIIGTYLHYV